MPWYRKGCDTAREGMVACHIGMTSGSEERLRAVFVMKWFRREVSDVAMRSW